VTSGSTSLATRDIAGPSDERPRAPPTRPLNTARHVGRLHALRAIARLLEDRVRAGLLIVGPEGAPTFIKDGSDGPWRILSKTYLESPTLMLELERAVRAAPFERPFRLPLGVLGIAGPIELPAGSGRVVALPFLASDRERRQAIEPLRAAGLKPAVADRLARGLLVLDPASEGLTTGALRVLEGETSRYTDAYTRSLSHERKSASARFPQIIGRAPPMMAMYSLMERYARSDATVYIHGENGTGKELVAAELHRNSGRADRAFVVQNCSALNDNLLESELFGHRRGAFTGAVADKPGLFEMADSGTFFLDEVGDMSPSLQVKLLRVVQEGTFTPVGDNVTRRVDVRLICATHHDLERRVSEGLFRQDLYYRLNVLSLKVPALRDRREDIPLLAEALLDRAERESGQPDGKKRFTDDALAALMAHDWPGNVRELENEIERIVVMTGPFVTRLGPEVLSPHILRRPFRLSDISALPDGLLPDAVERLERAMISRALAAHHGNKSKVANVLGVSRRNLIRKCQEYQL